MTKTVLQEVFGESLNSENRLKTEFCGLELLTNENDPTGLYRYHNKEHYLGFHIRFLNSLIYNPRMCENQKKKSVATIAKTVFHEFYHLLTSHKIRSKGFVYPENPSEAGVSYFFSPEEILAKAMGFAAWNYFEGNNLSNPTEFLSLISRNSDWSIYFINIPQILSSTSPDIDDEMRKKSS